MTDKPFDMQELTALASEACDLWQEHLTASLNDPHAHAELVKLLEPQRQLFATMFADYKAMMQNGAHAASSPSPTSAAGAATAAPKTGPAPAAAASDDGALRLAQLAHRLAELERRVAALERRDAAPADKAAKPKPAKH